MGLLFVGAFTIVSEDPKTICAAWTGLEQNAPMQGFVRGP